MADQGEPFTSHNQRVKPQQYAPSTPEPGLRMTSNRTTDQVIPQESSLIFQDEAMDVSMIDVQANFYLDLHESQAQGSYSADGMSYINVHTPSRLTEASSFEMVRSYSDKTNCVSEESDNQLYSTPNQGSAEYMWVHGAEFGVENGTSMPHDRDVLFFDMNPEPQPKHDPYQQLKANTYSEEIVYQESMVNYNTHSANRPEGFSPLSRSSKLQNGFEGPWNPVEPYQVPRFVPGDAAFAPSPGPAVQDRNHPSTPTTQSPQRTSNSPSMAVVEKSHSSKSKSKVKPKANDHKWIFVTEHADEESHQRRHGVRKGQLDPQVAERARRIRKLKACWKCRVQKVPCSEGKPCQSCIKQYSRLATQMCCRSGFNEYVPAFFPDYFHSHFNKKEIESLITANSDGFSDIVIEIDVSTGAVFKPMRVQTHVFRPKTWELVGHYQLIAEGVEQTLRLVQRYSAPVGIMALLREEMKIQCKDHIVSMVKNSRYAAQATAGHRTKLPRAILEAAQKFSAAKGCSLVHDALMLHAIHHFMSSLLTLTPESALKVYKSVRRVGAPKGDYLSSRLLNRQIKFVMHLLHREIYKSVLEDLERSLKSRSKESWGTSFCALLVLCLCIEELETAADIFVVCDMEKDGDASLLNRDQSFTACLELEENPFKQCTRLFHDIYRSGREARGSSGRDRGFNPLCILDGDSGGVKVDKPTDEMVKTISDMIYDSYGDIRQLSIKPLMVDHAYATASEIKDNNTGRVAAKFLISFFEDPNAV